MGPAEAEESVKEIRRQSRIWSGSATGTARVRRWHSYGSWRNKM